MSLRSMRSSAGNLSLVAAGRVAPSRHCAGNPRVFRGGILAGMADSYRSQGGIGVGAVDRNRHEKRRKTGQAVVWPL